jgi:DNA repair protein RadC
MKTNTPKFTLKDWSVDERPREKLINNGPQHLSNSELLALLIESGNKGETAVQLMQRLLVSLNNDLVSLHKVSLEELMLWKGIGPAKAVKIKAALELGKRIQGAPSSKQIGLTSSQMAYDVLFPTMTYLEQEEFWVLYLNIQHHVLEKKRLSVGGISETTVDIRILFKNALKVGAVSIIVAHNHPSGVLNPSQSDIVLTKKMKKVGENIDIKLLDHLIISEKGYFSFADENIL